MTPLRLNILAAVALCAALGLVLLTVPTRAAERCGIASYYCCEHHGRRTASGAVFNENAMTAAMPNRAELGRSYRVTYRGRSVVVRINDLGPHKSLNRIIDLSRAAASRLGMIEAGVARVCIERA